MSLDSDQAVGVRVEVCRTILSAAPIAHIYSDANIAIHQLSICLEDLVFISVMSTEHL